MTGTLASESPIPGARRMRVDAIERDEMASTNNPLEEILNSDVADSPFSSLVQPIQPPIGPSAARDPVPSDHDRSNHLYGPSPSTAAAAAAAAVGVPAGADQQQVASSNGPSSSAIQSALLRNHHQDPGSTIAAAVTKGFNNGVVVGGSHFSSLAAPPATQMALGPPPPPRGPLQVNAIRGPLAPTSSSGQSVSSSSSSSQAVTVANPIAASLAQSLGNFLNAAQFKQSNIAVAGLSNVSLGQKPNPSVDPRPMVTNVSGVPTTMQVLSQLHPAQHLSNVIAAATQVKSEMTPGATNLKPLTMAGPQQTQQQNLTLIQSQVQGTVGFPSQHVQILNVPTQNVQRASVAPVSSLRALAPRIAINQPVRIQQQQTQNLPMIRSQNVVTGPISFASGVQQNLLQGNMVLIKNERGQMVLLQNPNQPQPASVSSSGVIQSVQPSQARPQLAGQFGLVQTNATGQGQGLIAVSSAPTQFIQPTMAAAIRISSSGQGLVPVQSATAVQSHLQTSLHSVALSTPSIVSRLVPQGGIAQLNAAQLSTSTGAAVVASANANAKDIQESVRKCKNFLSTLMKLASNQPEKVVQNVKNLIQGLIDGNVEPEDFTNQLQKELKSSPQPYLVPFLRKSLPFLRHALVQNRMTIDGIRPPPASVATVGLSPSATTVAPAVPVFSVASSAANLRPRSVIPSSLTVRPTQSKPLVPPTTTVLTPQQQQLRLSMLQQQQQQQHQQHLTGLRMVGQKQPQPVLTADQAKTLFTRPALFPPPAGAGTTQPVALGANVVGASATVTSNGLLPQVNAGVGAAQYKGEKRKYEAMRDDDDINDVATMGGVNLMEESRNILATNSELVSGQLRSCKDEKFLETQVLTQRINSIVQRKGLDSCSQDVVNMISHAVQDNLRTIIEQLSLFVTHRLENYRTDPRFEMANERRVQLKFLEELGSIERKRHAEAERGVLMRAAKSRAKVEDPEQVKLKERAKAMQLAEMEEIRHREANLTALAAIGPRKPRTAQDMAGLTDSSSSLNKTIVPLRPRIKRVNLRDLLFLVEQRKESRRSTMLYKAFLK